MKKRWKGLLGICGAIAIVGAGMCIAAVAVGVDRSEIPNQIFPHVRWLHETKNDGDQERMWRGIAVSDVWISGQMPLLLRFKPKTVPKTGLKYLPVAWIRMNWM